MGREKGGCFVSSTCKGSLCINESLKRRPPVYKPGGFWRSSRHSNLISAKKYSAKKYGLCEKIGTARSLNFIIRNE